MNSSERKRSHAKIRDEYEPPEKRIALLDLNGLLNSMDLNGLVNLIGLCLSLLLFVFLLLVNLIKNEISQYE